MGSGPSWFGWGSQVLDNAPVFTYMDVPRMLRDPQVRFLERMWRAPFQKVKWLVKAEDKRVAKFVDVTLRRFWKRSLPKILSRYWRYGYAPGGAEFAFHKSWVRLERVRCIEPRDASPRVWTRGPHAGQPAGFTLSPGAGFYPSSNNTPAAWVGPPHAFWFAGYGDLTPWHDMPPISGLFDPWLEKRGRGGAISSRQRWFREAAWSGGTLYHPPGVTNVGTDEDPQLRDNQDIARESLDYMEAGSKLTLENTRLNGSDHREWEYEPPAARSDIAGLREYPKDLDREMSTGAGIPPEVLEASEVGSGWSGRLIPLLGYLGTVDELAGLLVEAADPWLRPQVAVNFGRGTWYEVDPQSLADEIAQQQGKGQGGGGGGGPNPVPGLFDGKPPAPPADNSQPLTLSATIPGTEGTIPGKTEEKVEKVHSYSSTHVNLPPELADRLVQLGMQIPLSDIAEKGREDEPHVTIRYGLTTEDPESVRSIFADAGPVKLKLGAVSYFPAAETGKDYDVLKVDVESAGLRRLNRELASVPHEDKFPDYRPHATIAYVKPGLGAKYAKKFGRINQEATVHEAVFSDCNHSQTRFPLGRPALEFSWTPYEGTHGGKGWVSDTGEVRYQEAKPGDDEGGDRGAESLFEHPDFAHISEHTSDAEPRDFAQIRADAATAAEKAGIDPAELHRRAAAGLHGALQHTAQYDRDRWSSARHLKEHDAQIAAQKVLASSHRELAESRRKSANHFRERESEYRKKAEAETDPTGKKGWEHLATGAASDAEYHEKPAVDSEQKATAAEAALKEHEAAAEKIRGGHVPSVKTSNKRNLFAGVYQNAHRDLAVEKQKRDDAQGFADSYYEHDNPLRRAAKYLKLTASGDLDADLLPADTRAAIVEDLAQIPPAKLAAHMFGLHKDGHDPDSAELQMATQAAAAVAKSKSQKPLSFDGSPDGYFVVHADEDEDAFKGLKAASQLAPGVKAPLDSDRAILVKQNTPLAKLAGDLGYTLEDESGLQPLFSSLKSPNMLPQSHVPESAKDYGGTSGSKGSGDYHPEESWDASKVPVYRRVNEDWFVKLRSAGDDQSEPYELVHKKEVPPLARLPEVYWKDWDPDTSDTDDDAVAEREKKEQKQSDEGAVQKRDIEEHREAIKGYQSEVGKLKTTWQQALKGVPEDERPDEPDWEDIDTSALSDQHDSREEHADALDSLSTEFHGHVENLQSEVDAAKEHAEQWRKENAEQLAAADKHRQDWRDTDKEIKGHVEKLNAAHELAQDDEDLHQEGSGFTLSDLADDAKGDAKRAHAEVTKAFDALDDSAPEHEEGPDPAEYEHSEDDLLPTADSGTPAEVAEEMESQANDHKERLEGLAKDAGEFTDKVAKYSKQWRKGFAKKLAKARDAVQKALSISADRYTDSEGPGEVVHQELTDANKGLLKTLAKLSGSDSVELSATVTPEDEQQAAAVIPGRLMRQRKTVLAQLLTLAMVRKQEEASTSGNPDAAAGSLEKLASLAGDPSQVAKIVGMRGLENASPEQSEQAVQQPEQPDESVNFSWTEFTGPRGGKGWKDSETGRVVYQRDMPGKHAERKASAQAAREILGRIHSGTGITASDLKELPKHIPLLTVSQLRNARILLEGKWGAKRGQAVRRDRMVQALLDHVDSLGKGPDTGLPGLTGQHARNEAEKVAGETTGQDGGETVATEPVQSPPSLEGGGTVAPIPTTQPKTKKAPPANGASSVPLYDSKKHGEHVLTGDDTYKNRKLAEDAARKSGIPDAKIAKHLGQWAVVKPKSVAAPEASGGGKIASLSDDDFGKKVQQVADAHTHGFGDNKVFIADVFDKLKEEDPTLSEDDFKRRLLESHAANRLDLSRADLVQAMHPDDVSRSETKHPAGAEFHFIQAARKQRENRGPLSPEEATRRHNEFVRQYQEKERNRFGAVPADAVSSPVMPEPTSPASPPPPPPTSPPSATPPTEPVPESRTPTDRGLLDSIKEATDRALGVNQQKLPIAPAKGQYTEWLRGLASDPAKFADLAVLAPTPALDRNELLAAVATVYGSGAHAEAKKKSKQGIVELLKGAKPV